MHAERVIDTTEIVAALQTQTPTNEQPGGDNTNGNNLGANNPLPPLPPSPLVRNSPPNNGGNNGGGNNGGKQQPVNAPTRTATTLEVVSGGGQTAETGQYLANPLIVRVRDQNSAVLSGVTVSFSVIPSVGVLNPASTTTGSDGQASTTLQFGETTGTYTVTVTATGVSQQVTFTATATARPTDSDWAQQSHYYSAEESKQGWLVWIYYPENYEGPRGTPGENDEANFVSNGFMLIPDDESTITEFSQTEGPCFDAEKPCHIGTVGDWENSTTYSVQIFLATTQDQASFQVIWDRKAENWTDGSPPPDMTYNLMASKNMMTGDQSDPDHTLQ